MPSIPREVYRPRWFPSANYECLSSPFLGQKLVQFAIFLSKLKRTPALPVLWVQETCGADLALSEHERAKCRTEDGVVCAGCKGNMCLICNWGCRDAIAVHVYCSRCGTIVKDKGEFEVVGLQKPNPKVRRPPS